MFPHGDGSLVRINLRYNVSESSTIYPEYIAYITYDQGSSKIFVGKPLSLVDVIINFWGTYWIPIVTIAVGIYILLSILTLRKWGLETLKHPSGYLYLPVGWFMAPFTLSLLISKSFSELFIKIKRRRYKNAGQVLEDIFELQKLKFLTYNVNVKFITLGNAIDNWNNTKGETKRQIFRYDMKAYNLVDYLFSLLEKRRSLLYQTKDNLVEQKIDNINHEIAAKCDEIINNIDWKDIANKKE